MWKGRAAYVTQKLRGYHQHQNGIPKIFLPAMGAATSLLLLDELDRRQFPKEEERVKYKIKHWIQERHLQRQRPLWSPDVAATTSCEGSLFMKASTRRRQSTPELQRRQTLQKMEQDSTKQSIDSRYEVDWDKPLGEGAFGAVYLAQDRESKEQVAVKKISKKYTNADEFYREMNALLRLQKAGGHPNICSLREHFNERGHYYVILDLVAGGEMFDHLVSQGAYSEADAARLVREIASSLLFIHGLSVVHGDLKPENLMLSSKNPSDAVIKLVDFGCAQVNDENAESKASLDETSITGKTLAYCPPEVLETGSTGQTYTMQPAMDLWSLGIILYIMLTGLHPYDIRGIASDEEVAKAIVSGESPPLHNSPITAHLSESALDVIKKLMERDPEKRMTAYELLQHPWVRGETASRDKIQNAGKRLAMYHPYKSGIERKVFENLITSSDKIDKNVAKRSSLIEQSFRSFDTGNKGHISQKDLQAVQGISLSDTADADSAPLSLSAFSDLLSEHMQNRYFPKGHVVYQEGEIGDKMFFISSGTVQVSTSTGTSVQRGPGDFFGEGALLNPNKRRSATIQCVTPVHAMEVSREYFDKYLAKSDTGLYIFLREKDNIRKRNRAKMILRLQKNLIERTLRYGESLFLMNEAGDSIYIVEEGRVDLKIGENTVFSATPGNIFGEYSALTGRPRNVATVCSSLGGCRLFEMTGRDFRKLVERAPDMKISLRNLGFRRDFKKAVVRRLNKEFPYDNPIEAFNAVKSPDGKDRSYLTTEEVVKLMKESDSRYEDEKMVQDLIKTMDLTGSGTVTFEEFKKAFIADIKGSASI